MQKVIVIYYDGNENRAKHCETHTPDASAPHAFGLPDDCDIVAVVTLEKEDGVIRHAVFIGEQEVCEVAWR